MTLTTTLLGTVRVGDIGTALTLTITEDGAVVDLTLATSCEVSFHKPDDKVATKTAVFLSPRTAGQIQYTTALGDLDQDGPWLLQARVYFGTDLFTSHQALLTVEPCFS